MFEDSITSSPIKSSKSIHDVRLLRRTKRKQIDCEKAKVDPQTFFRDFYHDSEEETDVTARKSQDSTFIITNPTSIVNNFRPFQLEKSFLLADHVAHECRRPPSNLSETQGFSTCQRLAEYEVDLNTYPKSKNTSFTITESELISCCNQAEKVFDNTFSEKVEKTLTESLADGDMSLVNSILEDFSQSPLKKTQITNHMSWQYTPEFRLRKIPMKTYSRKSLNKTRTNLSKHFSNQPLLDLKDEREACSNCSILSEEEEEDVTIRNSLSSSPVSVPGTSQCLSGNLLNLSVYFTENDLCIPFSTGNEDFSEHYIPNNSFHRTKLLPSNRRQELIQEILNLRAKCKVFLESYNSLEDFCGFPNSTDSDKYVSGGPQNNIKDEADHPISNSIDIAIKPNEYQSISISIAENDSLANWNLDNCEEIFACINTEEVIQKQHNYKICKGTHNSAIETTQDPSIDVGSKTDSSKPTKLSEEAHILADNALSSLPDIPAKQKESNLRNCDISIGDENLFEKSKEYEWNDDCDIFLNFQTPIALKENSKHELLQKSNEMALTQDQIKSQLPICTSKMCNIGFKTASGKNVSITKKAQEAVQELLNEFNNDELTEDLNCNELKEIKNKIFTKTHNKNVKLTANTKTVVKNCNVKQGMDSKQVESEGFKTANGKNIMVSSKAQESVNNLLHNFLALTKQDLDTDLLNLKQEITNKNLELKGLKTTPAISSSFSKVERITKASTYAKGTAKPHPNDVGKHNVDINRDGSNTINLHEKYLCENNPDFENLILSEWPLPAQNENFSSSIRKINSKETDLIKHSAGIKTNIGFQTANGKKVLITAKAQQSVEKLLREIDLDFDATNVENNLRKMKTDILNKNKAIEKSNIDNETLASQAISSSVLNQKPVKHSTTNKDIETNVHNPENNLGFQTANGRRVSVSAKAQEAVQKLLQEFETDLDAECYENYLKELKINIQNKNKPNVEVKSLVNQNCSQELEEYDNIVFSEWPLKETDLKTTPLLKNGKRRHSIHNGDITATDTSLSPPAKIMNKRSLHNTKSSFAESTLKSPLTQVANSVISRKNLLSLTKRKKSKTNSLLNANEEFTKRNQEIYEEKLNTVTPIKTINTLTDSGKTPATPNLEEFFTNAPHTSTPRNIDNNLRKSSLTINESDFKPINWNNNINNNNETSINRPQTKISDTSFSNITINSPNPTAKERIGRLKMYGKAPTVSPILIETHNSCRPSGLRRKRSMLKKSENN